MRLIVSHQVCRLSCLLMLLFSVGCAPAPQPIQANDTNPKVAIDDPSRPGGDWPRFLGTEGDNTAHKDEQLADKWPAEGPPMLWIKEIGTGYSAPSVLGDRIVIHHRNRREEIVECLNLSDAESIWQYAYPTNYSDPYGYNNGPRCTPLIAKRKSGTFCYTFGAEGKLLCLDFQTGKLIWQRDTQQDFKVPDAFFGVGATPILEGDKLIVLVGGQPNAAVVAFDAGTGETLWRNIGQDTWDGVATGWPPPADPTYEWTGEEMVVSYSSPIAATIHGRRHVLCLLRHGLVSVDPATGELNFKYWFRSRKYESVNAARPVVIGDKIFISSTYEVGAALLQVAPDGNSISELWRDTDSLQAHWSTPIVVDDHIYGFSGRHENNSTFRCLDLETGDLKWETTGYEGDLSKFGLVREGGETIVVDRETEQRVAWPYLGRGSLILADGKFIVLGERGTLALVNPSPAGYEEVSRFPPKQINYPSWTAPVLSRGRLLLRDEDTLVCYDIGAKAKSASP